jgi:hypothetical protein
MTFLPNSFVLSPKMKWENLWIPLLFRIDNTFYSRVYKVNPKFHPYLYEDLKKLGLNND